MGMVKSCDLTSAHENGCYIRRCCMLRWQFQLKVNMLVGSWGRATRPLRTAMDSSHTGLLHRCFQMERTWPEEARVAIQLWSTRSRLKMNQGYLWIQLLLNVVSLSLGWLSLVYSGQAALQDIARKTELHHARWGFSGSRSTWLYVFDDATGTS